MELLNSTKCVCGAELKEATFENYKPKPMNDRFYGGRVSMEATIKCECGRELKGYFETSYKMNSKSNYELIDLEVIKDIAKEEKIENKPTSLVEEEHEEEKTMLVDENVEYNTKSYDEMSYKELQAICKEKGIKSVGKKKDELVDILKGLN